MVNSLPLLHMCFNTLHPLQAPSTSSTTKVYHYTLFLLHPPTYSNTLNTNTPSIMALMPPLFYTYQNPSHSHGYSYAPQHPNTPTSTHNNHTFLLIPYLHPPIHKTPQLNSSQVRRLPHQFGASQLPPSFSHPPKTTTFLPQQPLWISCANHNYPHGPLVSTIFIHLSPPIFPYGLNSRPLHHFSHPPHASSTIYNASSPPNYATNSPINNIFSPPLSYLSTFNVSSHPPSLQLDLFHSISHHIM